MKIDIGKEGELIRDAAGKLKLVYHYTDFTKEDLLAWFRVKIQRGFISMSEMNNYLERIIDKLLGVHNLSKLSVYRYQVKEATERKIDEIVNEFTERKFKKLENESLLSASGTSFLFDDSLSLIDVCPDGFSKHLYEKAAKMNKEELELVYQIDSLSNIAWWFRNPEKTGFYVQGWLKNKFYPDFIVKTKKGNYFVLEYKGSHLATAEEAKYKKAIGDKWQELANGKYYFKMVDKNNIDEIINKISEL
jgi:type III restriction enzyme